MKYQIILASQSPRRQQILREMGFRFTVKILDTDESYPNTLPVHRVALHLAEKKADNYTSVLQDDEVVITADTTVVIEERILGKPENLEEARVMLQQLSGNMHEVITGVCISTKQSRHAFDDTTKVWFRDLDPTEIDHYIHTYRPFDKAGSYAIQEWIGLIGIEQIQGSYFNVVGLPAEKLYKTLKAIKVF